MYCSDNISSPGAPGPEEIYARLAEIERALNRAKDGLDDLDRAEYWLRMADSYSGLRNQMGRRGHLHVNNAWLKGYELFAAALDLQGLAGGRPLSAFLNAELPGGFIGALTAYAEREGLEVDWAASSLDPDGDPVALKDSYGWARRHPGRWLMGDGLAGDLRDAAQVAELVRRVKGRFPEGVDLYTSDAGYSVGGDYNRQEEILARLNLGQIVAGLGALRPGGSFVIKMFTFFSPFSATLLVLLSESFESLRVVKPLASRAANSEIYVVGEQFRGGADPQLAARLGDFEYAAFDTSAIADAAARAAALLDVASTLFGTIQTQALARVLAKHKVPPKARRLREEAWLESVRMADRPKKV